MTDNRDSSWPPSWIDEASRRGVDVSSLAGSPAADTELVLWRKIGPVSRFELGWALRRAGPSDILPPWLMAVDRVNALRNARLQVSGLSDETWDQLAAEVAATLTAASMTNADAIAAAILARMHSIREIRSVRVDEPVARGLTRSAIERSAEAVRVYTDRQPTQDAVAEALHVSVSTLTRAMKDLGMEGWPPRSPDSD